MTSTPPAPAFTVRALDAADADASRRLGFEAFGVPPEPPAEPAPLDQPGRAWYGAFDGDALVARALDRDYHSYWGGVALPTCGVAGVTVAAEHRRRGALAPLLAELLAGARSRGAVVSTLFPTAPGIYRGFGYEVVTELRTVEVPTAELAAVAAPRRTRTRRATAADVEALRRVYDAWATEQNGPLTRRGVSFAAAADELLGSVTGVTLAVDEQDRVRGYASWQRGQGYGESAVLEVEDLLALDADAYHALLRTVGSFASVTARTRIDTSGDDVLRTFLPTSRWDVVNTSLYMLKVLDVAAALDRRRYPTGLAATLSFRLAGDVLLDLDGGYHLEVAGGTGRCRRAEGGAGAGSRLFSSRGLALAYAGAQSSANLRMAGLLSGGDPAEDPVWDALLGGRSRHIRDYF